MKFGLMDVTDSAIVDSGNNFSFNEYHQAVTCLIVGKLLTTMQLPISGKGEYELIHG